MQTNIFLLIFFHFLSNFRYYAVISTTFIYTSQSILSKLDNLQNFPLPQNHHFFIKLLQFITVFHKKIKSNPLQQSKP